jgi:hypothetical protein
MIMRRQRILYAAILIAMATVVFVAANDHFQLGTGLFTKRPPNFDPYHLVRSMLMFLCSALLTTAIWITRKRITSQSLDRGSMLAIYVSAAAAIIAALVSIWHPRVFFWIAREGWLVETTSAAALFLASLAFLVAAFRVRVPVDGWGGRRAIICVALSLLMFVIGMEEISWTQGIVGFETPKLFASNLQNETNLHNFFTPTAENLYYAGAFLVLIFAPYLNEAYRFAVANHPLAHVAPDRSVALVAAPFTAFTWEMWNVIPIQMAFYLTIAILLAMLWDMVARQAATRAVVIPLFAMLFVQAIFLMFGDQLVRHHEATEYKELFISLAFLFYALKVAARAGTSSA